MRIRCERCATTYELDERKLPPHGGMVKCTRCQHVFRAAPPPAGAVARDPEPAPRPPPAVQAPGAPERTRPSPGNGVDGSALEKTAVFGFSAGGDVEGTASLGSAAPASAARAEGGAAAQPGEGGRAQGPGPSASGARRWVWLIVGVAVAIVAGLLLLR
ncbi:MAG TPA: zinc-ribbon domain-containing protein [Anaeromyxobacteraceae bacterium]|nr:zinc-ribbon domain-containing protein [Anaeromyxobacteraceae bacterium]